MNTENKIYNINYTKNIDMDGGMMFNRSNYVNMRKYADKQTENMRKYADKQTANMRNYAADKTKYAADKARNAQKYASAKVRFRPVSDLITDTLGGRVGMGVNCTTIPVLIEHLIRKYLISEQCTINKNFNYDFITGKRGEEDKNFADAKFRGHIYRKMMNWLSNKDIDDVHTEYEGGEEQDEQLYQQYRYDEEHDEEHDEYDGYGGSNDPDDDNAGKLDSKIKRLHSDPRLVIGGGLYNLDIGFVIEKTYVERNVNLFGSDRFFELIDNPNNNYPFEPSRPNPTIRMCHYFHLKENEHFSSIEEKKLNPKITVMTMIIKNNNLNIDLKQPYANPGIKKQMTKIEEKTTVENRNEEKKKEKVSVSGYTNYQMERNCIQDPNNEWVKPTSSFGYGTCYKKLSTLPLVNQEVPMLQANLQQVPVQQIPAQQIPVQQIPLQQIPVQQIPVQQMPVQQVQMIPVQMGGISDENDYLVKKQIGSKGFKKLRNGIKKLFDEFNESEQVNILKENDNNLLEYMIWNYGLKQNN